MEIRKKFNNSVREWGNNHPRGIKEITGKGLGDLLTTEVNFRRIGATAGALVPLAGAYEVSLNSVDFGNPIFQAVLGLIVYSGSFPVSVPLSIITGYLGYVGGEKIDSALGNNSPRWIGWRMAHEYRKR